MSLAKSMASFLSRASSKSTVSAHFAKSVLANSFIVTAPGIQALALALDKTCITNAPGYLVAKVCKSTLMLHHKVKNFRAWPQTSFASHRLS